MSHASTPVRSISAARRRSSVNGRNPNAKKGRKSKGPREMVPTKLLSTDVTQIDTIAEQVDSLARSYGFDKTDTYAALAQIGIRKKYRREFARNFETLLRATETDSQQLQLDLGTGDQTPGSSNKATATVTDVWKRMSRAVFDEIGVIEEELDRGRIRTYIAGAFVRIGLNHVEEIEEGFKELKRLADLAAADRRGDGDATQEAFAV